MEFLSTPSARRATQCPKCGSSPSPISIHALREEGDWPATFLSSIHQHFYPRPPRGGRRCAIPGDRQMVPISIHALREEGDRLSAQNPQGPQRISIHALREEGDWQNRASTTLSSAFLSTPSARRATIELAHLFMGDYQFLSTPSARRATEYPATVVVRGPFLSTPSARRATASYGASGLSGSHFYPRPPRGGRPQKDGRTNPNRYISIHALREEGDVRRNCSDGVQGHFYPRPPRGGRPVDSRKT